MEKLALTRACLSSVKVIMAIYACTLVELLCQAAIGCITALECLLPCVCGAYNRILSCQVINVTASQAPDAW
jgi:hypothetical protein